MEYKDCIWEIDNLDKRTIELSFSKDDLFKDVFSSSLYKDYEYIVSKVPSGNIDCLLGLQNEGFKIIELQINNSKKTAEFDYNHRLLRSIAKSIFFKPATTDSDLCNILNKMTPNMFSTDRVYLDPDLGPEKGLRRYKNWLTTEFHRGGVVYEFGTNDQIKGFALLSIENELCHYILGGVYEEFQNTGEGVLTAVNPFYYFMRYNIKVKKVYGGLSSNNFPMEQIYNFLNYKVDSLTYVLVKHQRIE